MFEEFQGFKVSVFQRRTLHKPASFSVESICVYLCGICG